MLHVILTVDIKNEKNVRNLYLFTGITIHAAITERQPYDCFMVA